MSLPGNLHVVVDGQTVSSKSLIRSLKSSNVVRLPSNTLTGLPIFQNGDFTDKNIFKSLPALPSEKKSNWCQTEYGSWIEYEHAGVTRVLLSGEPVDVKDTDPDKFNSSVEHPRKNLYVLSVGWMFFFMSFFSLRSLQSSMNHSEGLGLASLACIYTGFLLACLVTTPLVQNLGTKRTLVIGLVCHIIYGISNIYATFYTIIPSSLLAGFFQAAMWTAQGSYLVKISVAESTKTSKPLKRTTSKYFGVFFLCFSISPVFGSIMTSLLMNSIPPRTSMTFFINDSISEGYPVFQKLQQQATSDISWIHNASKSELAVTGKLYLTSENQTLTNSSKIVADYFTENSTNLDLGFPLKSCGMSFCNNQMNNADVFIISLETRIIIIGSFVICMIVSVVIFALFLEEKRPCRKNYQWSTFVAQFKELLTFMKDPQFHFLMPLIFFHGFQTSFYSGEITKAYVTCLFGMEKVGYSMACFGCSAGISSYLSCYLKRYISRIFILLVGFLTNVGCLLAFSLWEPTDESLVGVFALVALWGMADGIWMTHINCVTGLLFPTRAEAAYTAFQLCVALGMVVGYSTSQHLCMLNKICAVGVLGAIGMAGFTVLKWSIRQEGIIAKRLMKFKTVGIM